MRYQSPSTIALSSLGLGIIWLTVALVPEALRADAAPMQKSAAVGNALDKSIGVIVQLKGNWVCTIGRGPAKPCKAGDLIMPDSMFKMQSPTGILTGLLKSGKRFTCPGPDCNKPIRASSRDGILEVWNDFVRALSQNVGDWITPRGRAPDAHLWLKECVLACDEEPNMKVCMIREPRSEYSLTAEPSPLIDESKFDAKLKLYEVSLKMADGNGEPQVKDACLVLVVPANMKGRKETFDAIAAEINSWSDMKLPERAALIKAALLGIGTGKVK